MATRSVPILDAPFRAIFNAICILISSSGVLFRAITLGQTPEGTSGRNTKAQKASTLNTKGVYSLVRHPLYFGNFLIWLGIVLFTLEPAFVLISLLLFGLVYERIMYTEERFLAREFGEELEEWAEKVPAFIPRSKGYVPIEGPFSLKRVLRKEYSGFMATVISFVYVAFLRDLFQSTEFTWDPTLGVLLLAAGLITLTLRTLHRNTSLLKDR